MDRSLLQLKQKRLLQAKAKAVAEAVFQPEKKKRKKKKKSKSKSSKREEHPRDDVWVPPIVLDEDEPKGDTAPLTDSKSSEPIRVEKGAAGPPRVIEDAIDEEYDQPVDAPPPLFKEEEEPTPAPEEDEGEEAEDEEEEEADDEDEDKITKSDLLEAAEETIQELNQEDDRKGHVRRTSAQGGEIGAALEELKSTLHSKMVNPIHHYFVGLWKQCRKAAKSRVDGGEDEIYEKTCTLFKEECSKVRTWDQAKINRRAKDIVTANEDTVDYFRYAYAAGIMLVSKVVQEDDDSTDLEVQVPKFSEFVKRAYLQAARVHYINVGALNSSIPHKDRISIMKELNQLYREAINTALQSMIPLSQIAPKSRLSEFPRENYDEFADVEDEEAFPESSEEEDDDDDDEGEPDVDEEEEAGEPPSDDEAPLSDDEGEPEAESDSESDEEPEQGEEPLSSDEEAGW
ncbi:hypothetical protein [Sicyoidochytrium minutum DNA virus]|nr:hypothetical protein [Sicyoidochytrium minutum DNA virus]